MGQAKSDAMRQHIKGGKTSKKVDCGTVSELTGIQELPGSSASSACANGMNRQPKAKGRRMDGQKSYSSSGPSFSISVL